MSLKTAHYEIAYEQMLGRMNRVFDCESARLLRVDRVLLEADNDLLYARFEHADKERVRVSKTESDTRWQLADAHSEIDDLQTTLRSNSRQIDDLKKEITLLRNSSVEAKQLLDEKISLTKELGDLQLETERLKAQNTLYQNVLAEKSTLERQLSSLEVQFETERRAFERTRANDSRRDEEGAKLRTQLEELQTKNFQESSENERLERENYKKTIEWKNQRTLLEDKLESLTEELSSTKDRLDRAENQLQQQNVLAAKEQMIEATKQARNVPINQTAPRFDPDMTIATPGAAHVSIISKRPSAFPGDKSAFSITPFLGRTSTAPSSSSSQANHSEEHEMEDDCEPQHISDMNIHRLENDERWEHREHPRKRATKNSLHDSETQQARPRLEGMKRASSKESRKPLEQPAEGIQSIDADNSMNDLSAQGGLRLKKRKVLGSLRDRTLFDEEDDNPGGKKQERRLLGPAWPGVGSQLSSTTIVRPSKNRKLGASAQFSPLKRDRKRL